MPPSPALRPRDTHPSTDDQRGGRWCIIDPLWPATVRIYVPRAVRFVAPEKSSAEANPTPPGAQAYTSAARGTSSLFAFSTRSADDKASYRREGWRGMARDPPLRRPRQLQPLPAGSQPRAYRQPRQFMAIALKRRATGRTLNLPRRARPSAKKASAADPAQTRRPHPVTVGRRFMPGGWVA
jgi:hypothetical protein